MEFVNTFWALVPPIVAIVLALITKETYSSLFIGILVGAFFVAGLSPIGALDTMINDGFIGAIADGWNAGIFMFLVILGIMVALINAAGGSASFGNVTTAAEFNIHADPEAAQIVFQSGLHIVMCGLDVTLKAVLTPDDWNELAESCPLVGPDWILPDPGVRVTSAVPELQGAWRVLGSIGMAGVPMHDSCPVLYLVHPELFTAEEAGVFVETRGTVTLGKTVTDLHSDKKFDVKNTTVVLDVDRDKFIEILKDCIKKI